MIQKFILQKPNLQLALPVALLAVALGSAFGFVLPYIDNPAVLLVMIAGIPAVILTIMYPDYGVMFLVFLAYSRLSDSLEKYMGLPSVFLPFLGLLFVVVGIRWFLYNERPRFVRKAYIIFIIYAIMALSSLLYARDYQAAYLTYIEMIKAMVVAVVIILLVKKVQSLRLIIWALILSGVLMGTISVYQYFTGTFTNPYWGFGRAQIQNITSGEDAYRLGGSVGDPNFYAQILLVIVPLALDRVWNERNLLLRAVAGWSLAVTALTIVLTFSRGALVALILMGVVIFVRRPPKLSSLIVTALLILPLLQFIPQSYLDRISTLTDLIPGLGAQQSTAAVTEVSYRGRLSEMLVGIYMFEDNPLLGVGMENYPAYYQEYSRELGLDPRLEERHPHSLYIQVAAEHGVIGLVAFTLLFAAVFRDLYLTEKKLKKLGLYEEAGMVSGIMIGIIAYLMAGIFLHNAYPRFFWTLVGIALACPNIVRNMTAQVRQQIPDPTPSAVLESPTT